MKIVSFYTPDKYYQEHAKRLEQQCFDLNIETIIEEKEFGKSWIDNVRAKPIFLKEILNYIKDDFIWLDVDCEVLKFPNFKSDGRWMVDFRNDGTPHDYIHVIPNRIESLYFINEWIDGVKNSNCGSHSVFNKICHYIRPIQIPSGYFQLGLSDVESKKDYFKNERN